MKPKIKKPRKTRKPRTKSTKQMKDKSIKQNVNVNVTSSGGGGSGGSSIPSSQPFQNPILNQFRQSEKTGENVDIKNLTQVLKNLGVGLSEKTSDFKAPLFESDLIPSEIQIKRNPITNNNNIIENLDAANKQRDINEAENINNPDIQEEALEVNNPRVYTQDEIDYMVQEKLNEKKEAEKARNREIQKERRQKQKQLSIEKQNEEQQREEAIQRQLEVQKRLNEMYPPVNPILKQPVEENLIQQVEQEQLSKERKKELGKQKSELLKQVNKKNINTMDRINLNKQIDEIDKLLNPNINFG